MSRGRAEGKGEPQGWPLGGSGLHVLRSRSAGPGRESGLLRSKGASVPGNVGSACWPVGSSELLWNFALGSQWCPPWHKPSVTQERG